MLPTFQVFQFVAYNNRNLLAVEAYVKCPFISLSTDLAKIPAQIPEEKMPKRPFLRLQLNVYTSNTVAADHLLADLGKGLLEISFLQVASDDSKTLLDVYHYNGCRQMGLDSEATIYNIVIKSLHAMFVSTTYGILCVNHIVLHALSLIILSTTSTMLCTMQRLV